MKILFICIFALLASCSDNTPPLQALTEDAVILAFGDSLTYGTGANPQQSYPQQLLALTGHKVINSGVPGEITQQGLARLPQVLAEVQPQLVVLIHGGNDILRKGNLTQTANNLRQMIRLIRASNAQVVMMGVPKPGLFLNSADFYAQVATEEIVPIDLDTIASILQSGAQKSDAIHPNAKGYQVMAEALVSLLHKAGALR